jgi:hypothetical protein
LGNLRRMRLAQDNDRPRVFMDQGLEALVKLGNAKAAAARGRPQSNGPLRPITRSGSAVAVAPSAPPGVVLSQTN